MTMLLAGTLSTLPQCCILRRRWLASSSRKTLLSGRCDRCNAEADDTEASIDSYSDHYDHEVEEKRESPFDTSSFELSSSHTLDRLESSGRDDSDASPLRPSKELEKPSADARAVKCGHVVGSLATSKPVLKSALRSGSKGKRIANTKRRVRGLWNEHCGCLFSALHDDALVFILSHLSVTELCRASMVCRRWRHITARVEQSWVRVDVTDFVHDVFRHFEIQGAAAERAQEEASLALSNKLQKHSLEALTIRSIEHRLALDSFLPKLKDLQELTLTGFADLSDIHVHAMLLSNHVADVQARSRKGNMLRKLCLEQCPLLTNATVRSIALTCPNLQSLSLRGNRQIDSVQALQECWKVEVLPLKIPTVQSTSSIQSLFSPPPTQTRSTSTLTSSSEPCAASALSSLFGPPTGTSPKRAPPRTGSFILASAPTTGKLCRIDLSGTKVTPSAFIASLKGATGRKVLESLRMRGSGESWRNRDIQELCKWSQVSALQVLDVGCANPFQGSSILTALESMLLDSAPLQLESLVLSGHKALRGTALASIVAAAPVLVELNLEGCKAISTDNESALLLSRALCLVPGLRQVNLARCFASRRMVEQNPDMLAAEESCGRTLLSGIMESTSKSTLTELDVSGCWFVSQDDASKLRKECSSLKSLRMQGTRGADRGSLGKN